MRYLALTLFNFLFCLSTLAQNDDKQMPITVDFQDGSVVFTLPPPYHNPDFLPMSIPRFVRSIRSTRMPEFVPTKQEMLKVLQDELAESPGKKPVTEIQYLKDLALFIFLSNNNTHNLPPAARTVIAEWNKANISFKEELKLVTNYLKMADQFNK